MTEEQKLEYEKCANDFIYFIDNYTFISKNTVLVADFRLYPFQKDVLNAVHQNSTIFINSARQMGVTKILMGYILWNINFKEGYHVAMSNVSYIQSIRSLEVLKYSYERLPDFLKTSSAVNLKTKLSLINKSEVVCASANRVGLCTKLADLVVIDNAAFMNSAEDIYSSLILCLRPGGKIIISSTLYKTGWFAEMCKRAEEGENDFTYIKLPYWLHPKKTRIWRAGIDRTLGSDVSKVEYDCSYYYDEDGSIKPLIDEDSTW